MLVSDVILLVFWVLSCFNEETLCSLKSKWWFQVIFSHVFLIFFSLQCSETGRMFGQQCRALDGAVTDHVSGRSDSSPHKFSWSTMGLCHYGNDVISNFKSQFKVDIWCVSTMNILDIKSDINVRKKWLEILILI